MKSFVFSMCLVILTGCQVTPSEPVTIQETSSSSVSPLTDNTVRVCGISLTFDPKKYGEPVTHTIKPNDIIGNEPFGRTSVSVTFGEAMPESPVYFECTSLLSNPQTEMEKNMNDSKYVLSIQSDGAELVSNPLLYPIFGEKLLAQVNEIYSAKNRGYREGSETIGFAANGWLYQISFLSSSEIRSTNSFRIEAE